MARGEHLVDCEAFADMGYDEFPVGPKAALLSTFLSSLPSSAPSLSSTPLLDGAMHSQGIDSEICGSSLERDIPALAALNRRRRWHARHALLKLTRVMYGRGPPETVEPVALGPVPTSVCHKAATRTQDCVQNDFQAESFMKELESIDFSKRSIGPQWSESRQLATLLHAAASLAEHPRSSTSSSGGMSAGRGEGAATLDGPAWDDQRRHLDMRAREALATVVRSGCGTRPSQPSVPQDSCSLDDWHHVYACSSKASPTKLSSAAKLRSGSIDGHMLAPTEGAGEDAGWECRRIATLASEGCADDVQSLRHRDTAPHSQDCQSLAADAKQSLASDSVDGDQLHSLPIDLAARALRQALGQLHEFVCVDTVHDIRKVAKDAFAEHMPPSQSGFAGCPRWGGASQESAFPGSDQPFPMLQAPAAEKKPFNEAGFQPGSPRRFSLSSCVDDHAVSTPGLDRAAGELRNLLRRWSSSVSSPECSQSCMVEQAASDEALLLESIHRTCGVSRQAAGDSSCFNAAEALRALVCCRDNGTCGQELSPPPVARESATVAFGEVLERVLPEGKHERRASCEDFQSGTVAGSSKRTRGASSKDCQSGIVAGSSKRTCGDVGCEGDYTPSVSKSPPLCRERRASSCPPQRRKSQPCQQKQHYHVHQSLGRRPHEVRDVASPRSSSSRASRQDLGTGGGDTLQHLGAESSTSTTMRESSCAFKWKRPAALGDDISPHRHVYMADGVTGGTETCFNTDYSPSSSCSGMRLYSKEAALAPAGIDWEITTEEWLTPCQSPASAHVAAQNVLRTNQEKPAGAINSELTSISGAVRATSCENMGPPEVLHNECAPSIPIRMSGPYEVVATRAIDSFGRRCPRGWSRKEVLQQPIQTHLEGCATDDQHENVMQIYQLPSQISRSTEISSSCQTLVGAESAKCGKAKEPAATNQNGAPGFAGARMPKSAEPLKQTSKQAGQVGEVAQSCLAPGSASQEHGFAESAGSEIPRRSRHAFTFGSEGDSFANGGHESLKHTTCEVADEQAKQRSHACDRVGNPLHNIVTGGRHPYGRAAGSGSTDELPLLPNSSAPIACATGAGSMMRPEANLNGQCTGTGAGSVQAKAQTALQAALHAEVAKAVARRRAVIDSADCAAGVARTSGLCGFAARGDEDGCSSDTCDKQHEPVQNAHDGGQPSTPRSRVARSPCQLDAGVACNSGLYGFAARDDEDGCSSDASDKQQDPVQNADNGGQTSTPRSRVFRPPCHLDALLNPRPRSVSEDKSWTEHTDHAPCVPGRFRLLLPDMSMVTQSECQIRADCDVEVTFRASDGNDHRGRRNIIKDELVGSAEAAAATCDQSFPGQSTVFYDPSCSADRSHELVRIGSNGGAGSHFAHLVPVFSSVPVDDLANHAGQRLARFEGVDGGTVGHCAHSESRISSRSGVSGSGSAQGIPSGSGDTTRCSEPAWKTSDSDLASQQAHGDSQNIFNSRRAIVKSGRDGWFPHFAELGQHEFSESNAHDTRQLQASVSDGRAELRERQGSWERNSMSTGAPCERDSAVNGSHVVEGSGVGSVLVRHPRLKHVPSVERLPPPQAPSEADESEGRQSVTRGQDIGGSGPQRKCRIDSSPRTAAGRSSSCRSPMMRTRAPLAGSPPPLPPNRDQTPLRRAAGQDMRPPVCENAAKTMVMSMQDKAAPQREEPWSACQTSPKAHGFPSTAPSASHVRCAAQGCDMLMIEAEAGSRQLPGTEERAFHDGDYGTGAQGNPSVRRNIFGMLCDASSTSAEKLDSGNADWALHCSAQLPPDKTHPLGSVARAGAQALTYQIAEERVFPSPSFDNHRSRTATCFETLSLPSTSGYNTPRSIATTPRHFAQNVECDSKTKQWILEQLVESGSLRALSVQNLCPGVGALLPSAGCDMHRKALPNSPGSPVSAVATAYETVPELPSRRSSAAPASAICDATRGTEQVPQDMLFGSQSIAQKSNADPQQFDRTPGGPQLAPHIEVQLPLAISKTKDAVPKSTPTTVAADLPVPQASSEVASVECQPQAKEHNKTNVDVCPPSPKKESAPPPPKPSSKAKGPGKGAPPLAKKGSGKGAPKAEPRKPEVKPQIPLKKLFWNSFCTAASSSHTVWDKIHGSEVLFNQAELEQLFAEMPVHLTMPSGSPADCERSKSKPLQKKRLFDERRRRAIWFMLALMPDRKVLPDAVLRMDCSLLECEKIDLLLTNLPCTEEERMITSAMAEPLGENEVWDAPEEFMMALISTPQYSLRVRAWAYLNSFETAVERIANAEVGLRGAINVLRRSARIENLLAFILNVGNYLNGGTSRGRADGFDVCDTLTKVGKLKSAQTGTLLDFIVKEIEKEYPGMLHEMYMPGAEYERVHCARKHKIPELKEELGTLLKQAESHVQQIKLHVGSDTECSCAGDEAMVTCSQKLGACIERLRSISDGFSKFSEAYNDLCSWFNMDTDKPRPCDEFLGIWCGFLLETKQALDTFDKKREKERKQRLNTVGKTTSLPPPPQRSRGLVESLPAKERMCRTPPPSRLRSTIKRQTLPAGMQVAATQSSPSRRFDWAASQSDSSPAKQVVECADTNPDSSSSPTKTHTAASAANTLDAGSITNSFVPAPGDVQRRRRSMGGESDGLSSTSELETS